MKSYTRPCVSQHQGLRRYIYTHVLYIITITICILYLSFFITTSPQSMFTPHHQILVSFCLTSPCLPPIAKYYVSFCLSSPCSPYPQLLPPSACVFLPPPPPHHQFLRLILSQQSMCNLHPQIFRLFLSQNSMFTPITNYHVYFVSAFHGYPHHQLSRLFCLSSPYLTPITMSTPHHYVYSSPITRCYVSF